MALLDAGQILMDPAVRERLSDYIYPVYDPAKGIARWAEWSKAHNPQKNAANELIKLAFE